MMAPRLVLARELLSDDGVIAVSIDEHEDARLRLLLEEVFGESNFLAEIVVALNPKGRQLAPHFATSHEYVLLFARDVRRTALIAATRDGVDPADFPREDERGRHRLLPLRNTNKKFNPATSRTMHFAVWAHPEDGRVRAEPFEGAIEVRPVFGDGTPAVWRWSAARIAREPESVVARWIDGALGRRLDVFQVDRWTPERTKKLRTIWTSDEIGSTDDAVNELKALVGPVFPTPKPVGLLRRLLATMPRDAVVLDAFAGSGTTGQAVVEANAEDGGSRRCISVNSAEPVRPGSNADLAGYATVADITRARLRAVAETVGWWFRGDGFRDGRQRALLNQRDGGRVMSDRVALVTGASSGIGEATARQLRAAGFTTYAVARRVDRMAGLAEEGVHTFAMDVTDDASMTSGVQRVLDEQGRIDVLVNNAGYGSYGAVEDVPIDEARRQFEVNVFGLARLVQLVVPHMRDQKSGRIINISSIGGKFYEPLGAWYHATKFAVEGFSDSLRLELAPFGIRVVIVEPGPIITEWNTIARDSLVETSRGGAYEERSLARVHQTMERGDTGWAGSSPDVVAKKIVSAATARRPKIRYPVGKGAGGAVWPAG